MNESQVKRRLKRILTAHHWEWIDFSMHRKTPKQMKGWVDILAWRWDHVLYIEAKGLGGSPSPDQLEFRNRVMPHSGPHIMHVFVYPETDIHELALFGIRNRPHGLDYEPEDLR
jgi:hypothetical protein